MKTYVFCVEVESEAERWVGLSICTIGRIA